MLVTGYIWTQISWIFPYTPNTVVFCYTYLYLRTVLLYSGDHCILRVYCTSTPKVDRQQSVPGNMIFYHYVFQLTSIFIVLHFMNTILLVFQLKPFPIELEIAELPKCDLQFLYLYNRRRYSEF